MAISEGLNRGIELVSAVATVYIGVYALLMIGTLFLGVVANLVASGDVTVSGNYTSNESAQDGVGGAIYSVENSFQNTITTITNPITVVASLVIVGVLVLMFPRFTGSGTGGKGDVL